MSVIEKIEELVLKILDWAGADAESKQIVTSVFEWVKSLFATAE